MMTFGDFLEVFNFNNFPMRTLSIQFHDKSYIGFEKSDFAGLENLKVEEINIDNTGVWLLLK